MHSEDIDQSVSDLLAAMRSATDDLRVTTEALVGDSEVAKAPDLDDLAADSLRDYLLQETIALVEPEGESIQLSERQHEVIKKALVGLKLPALRSVASSRGLVPDGPSDDLARRVASDLRWDPEAVAQLILDQQEEPRETEGGPSARVFVLRDPAELSHVRRRLRYVDGRYYRTGTARWFVFEAVDDEGDNIRLSGSLRTFRPLIDEVEGKPRLSAEEDVATATLEIRQGSRFAWVHDASSQIVARSLMAAFQVAVSAPRLEHVPNANFEAQVLPNSIHPTTMFLIDLIANRFKGRHFKRKNPILARFKLGFAGDGSARASTKTPRLTAVRFEGEYLLESPSTCGLMWTEGRPLVDLTMRTSVQTEGEEGYSAGTFPVRVAVERDHVLIAVGLGSGDIEVMQDVHNAALRAVESSLLTPVRDADAEAIARVIRRQAESPDPDVEATLLADADDEGGA